MSKKNALKHFEKSIESLENLVHTLEKGELGLEESLKQFEKGIQWVRECEQALTEAEQRVSILVDEELETFDALEE